MLSRGANLGQSSDRVALKDERLVYRACSTAFAQSIGCLSAKDVIGKTDFDLFPSDVAREQMALDSRTIYAAEADISTINLGPSADSPDPRHAMIVRTPVVGEDNKVRGVDIRLLGGPAINAPRSAVSIDYQTLVNDGIQGSLIISRESILFANDNAARVLGYPSAQALIDSSRVSDIFSAAEHQRALDMIVTDASVPSSLQRVNLQATSRIGSLIRLIARVNHVQWGASRATLLSFVDVAVSDSNPSESNQQLMALPAAQLEELKRLRVNEMRYRHYASATADFFWEMDAQMVFRVVSDGLANILGIPREHILGRSLQQLLDHPANINDCLLYTSPSPRDKRQSRMPSSA